MSQFKISADDNDLIYLHEIIYILTVRFQAAMLITVRSVGGGMKESIMADYSKNHCE